MPGLLQARLGDMHMGACTTGSPLPIMPPCEITVMVVKKPAARMGDMCTGFFPPPAAPCPPHPIAKGSTSVMIGKKPAARMMDMCGMGSPITIVPQISVCTGG